MRNYNIDGIIEELTIKPTHKQAQTCLIVCQYLSNCYQDIHLFRFDDQTGEVYILAGEEIEIIVLSNGIWEFL
ncbi:DUF6888 family protein [Planktothrix tepida]|uniref:DUF6888 family protein n=1 Tax=Planktothrix tepida TaxID=1678309 RepID=UPI003F580E17